MPDNYITLSQLTKTTKGLVNKINAESTITNNKIGDLTDLNTTAKTNLVAAINEAAASGGNTYDDTALAGRVTALENAGYITSYTETDPVFTASAAANISSTDISNWNAKSDFSGSYNDLEDKPTIPNVPAWALAANKPTYTANEVGALPNTTVIPTVPTDVSAFNNDAGYLTSYTETDPTVPAWAKAANKPTYTAAEVGALPDTTVIPAAQVNADWDATSGVAQILHKPTIPTIPTNVSAFTNDSGYLTSYTETDPTVPAWAKAESKPTYTAQEVGALPDDTIIPTVPTNISAFTNDAGYLTSYTETDPTVPAWAKASAKPTYTASEVGAMATTHAANSITSSDISNWNSKTSNTGTVASIRVQATAPVQSSVNTAQSTTLNTTISLASGYGDTQNPYASKTANYVLASPNGSNGTPSFRKLVTTDLPSIGNITNAGDITTTATIASGDRLIINDESASKIINSSITFGSSTAQYLANNGTWQNTYDDSALAARVTALEQLEWATYYSGRSNPSNSQGQNGDIYLQY